MCTAVLIGWDHRVHTEKQRPLSGVHSIMMEKLTHPLSLYIVYTITYKIAVYSPAEWALGRYTHPISSLLIDVLFGWDPAPPHLGSYTRALLVSQDRRHLFVTPGWNSGQWGCTGPAVQPRLVRSAGLPSSLTLYNVGTIKVPIQLDFEGRAGTLLYSSLEKSDPK